MNERLGRRKKEAQAGLDLALSFGLAETPQSRLGAIIGGLAREGAGKLTLILSPQAAALGPAIAEIVARSGGDRVIPIVGEPLGHKESYGLDRLFISITIEGEEQKLPRLAESGQPLLHWTLPAPLDLSAELARWEAAAAVTARILDVGPARAAESTPETEPALRAQGFALFTDAVQAQILRKAAGTLGAAAAASPAGWIAAFLALADAGDYVALCAFLPESLRPELSKVQGAIRDATRLACTAFIGGDVWQYGSDRGLHLVLTSGEEGGAALLRLQGQGRRALRLHAEDGDSQKIIETLHAATKLLLSK